MQSLDTLLKRYVVDMLALVPGSRYKFNSLLVCADGVLCDCLLEREPHNAGDINNLLQQEPSRPNIGTPAVLYSHMQQQTEQLTNNFLTEKRTVLIQTVLYNLSKCGLTAFLPEFQEVLNARENPMSPDKIAFPPTKAYQPVICIVQRTDGSTDICTYTN